MQFSSFFLIIASYLIGAVPFGLLLSRGKGINIREQGSKNIGATNVSRLLGKKLGFLTFLLDCTKGFLPMFLAGRLLGEGETQNGVIALCGAAAVIGHMFPIYLRFKGGKGVATGLGVFLYLAPLAVLISMVIFIAVVAATGYVSLGSLLSSAVVLPCLYFFAEPSWKLSVAGFIIIMIWIKHHENIGRLLKGTEKSFKKKKELAP
ncbi:MAG: glycerol-3-phosphate 1-O-acyltransferase PlsY [Candidatus Electrothrix aestuarii]|jgi:glycerol-3-phosphate acyltransferase PlsY|uniref:Glycerol-3-phosphate acyltransferase n=1 Tax=Candidatus Electrothrix aestuarii TaxID=3062594 RepID=A0AAU8LYT4_9BACT|nr:glycerol-3-phosphate 1-O-acyltransferase PlsY [Candidatus Electrothrix aestuarii]